MIRIWILSAIKLRPVRGNSFSVGFALPYVGATVGGGYTFSREILRALAKCQGDWPFRGFALIHEGLEPPDLDIPVLTLRKAKAQPFVEAIVDCFSRARFSMDRPSSVWLADGVAIGKKLDAIVHLYPGTLEGADVLQISTIWDLSHRYIPGFPELSHGKERRNREAKFQKIINCSDFVVTGTRRGVRELEQYYGVEDRRVFRIPHPTPDDALEAADFEDEQADTKREEFALYPAQLWPHKNHRTLLSAWGLLRRRGNSNLRLVCPGSDYGLRNWLIDKAREEGVEGLVDFPGFVERAELISLYRRASLLVYPSLFGPENLPPLEAFALGCPVIASAIPGADEQLGDAALLVDPLDADQWANAVVRVSKDPSLRSSLVGNGQVRARSLTSQDFARSLIDALERVALMRSLWPERGYSL
jgi:glycosyltransferase involved in cell wall biosynthesis